MVPADVAVPAHPTSVQPHLTEAMVKLLAAASNMAPPAPPLPSPTDMAAAEMDQHIQQEMQKLLDTLEGLDDVQDVFHNAEMADPA